MNRKQIGRSLIKAYNWMKLFSKNLKLMPVYHVKHAVYKLIQLDFFDRIQKQQFYEQFEIFLKIKYINGIKIFRGIFTYKLCPKKI